MNNAAVILAGGQGKRMKAEIPKPMFKVLGEPMLEWGIVTARARHRKALYCQGIYV